MKKNKSSIFSNPGFTLTEVLLGVGISAMVLMFATTVFRNYVKVNKNLERLLNIGQEEISAQRYFQRDLKSAYYSFIVLRKNDTQSNNFWDYFSDYPAQLTGSRITREFLLTPNGEDFPMLVGCNKLPNAIKFTPASAYNTTAGGITFNSLNKDGQLQRVSDAVHLNSPEIWIPNQLLLLFSPANLRPITNGTVDFTQAPHWPYFLGAVSGSSGLRLNPVTLPGHNKGDVLSVPSQDFATEGDFMKALPVVGGGDVLFYVKCVNLISYKILRDNTLVRINWATTGTPSYRAFTAGDSEETYLEDLPYKVIVKNVKQVKFKRESISRTTIDLDIEQKKINTN